MLVDYGTYTGDGLDDRAITSLGWKPDILMIKGDGLHFLVWKSPVMGVNTAHLGGGIAHFTGGIKSLDATGFTLGTDATVNGSGVVYYWTAIRANGMNDVAFGTYTGNGSTQDVTLPFTPDLVWTKRDGVSSAGWKSSVHAANTFSQYSSADNTSGLMSLGTSKFTVGNIGNLNTNASIYYYAAFKAGEKLQVGTYTGNGVNDREITISAGFNASYVSTKSAIGIQAGVRMGSETTTNGNTYLETAVATTRIRSITPNGFTLGTGTSVNQDAIAFWWYAFAKHRSRNQIASRTAVGSRGAS